MRKHHMMIYLMPLAFCKTITASAAVLGLAYSSDKQQFLPSHCLREDAIVVSDQGRSDISLSAEKSFDDLQQLLQINVDVSGRLDMFSTKARAKYMKSLKQQRYSQSFHFTQMIYLPGRELKTGFFYHALNDEAKILYDKSPEKFVQVCGDRFVVENHPGGLLAVSLKAIFSSASEKRRFTRLLSMSYAGLLQATAQVQQIMQYHHIQGYLEFSAYQEGGHVQSLNKIFTKNADGYYMTQCAINNPQACQAVVQAILDYANHDFVNQFNKDDSISSAGLDYRLASYESLGLSLPDSSITPNIIVARRRIGEWYLRSLEQLSLLSHILNHPVLRLNSTDLKRLQHNYQHIRNNIAVLSQPESGARVCYDKPQYCEKTASTLKSLLQSVDASLMALYGNGWSFTYYGYEYTPSFDLAPLGENAYIQVNATESYPVPFAVRFHIQIDAGKHIAHVKGSNGYSATLQQTGPDEYTGYTVPANLFARLLKVPNPL